MKGKTGHAPARASHHQSGGRLSVDGRGDVALSSPHEELNAAVFVIEALKQPRCRHSNAARSNSRAFCQSRRTVRSVNSSTSAISLSLKPPK